MRKIWIQTFKVNAGITFITEKMETGESYIINWDGYEFETKKEYYEQINKWLEPLRKTGFTEEEIKETKEKIEIATDYLKP